VIALAVQPVLLLSNAYILAQTLNIVFDIQAETLFTLSLFWGSYPVSVFTLGAVVVTLAQMVSAAIAAAEVPGRRHCFIRWCGGFALGLLAIVEICLNVDRTVISGGSKLECVLSGALAAALVVTESAIGCLILDYLMVPLALSILWGLSNLSRHITRGVSHLIYARRVVEGAQRTRPIVGHAVADGLDRFFSLFRRLDEIVANLLRRVPGIKSAGASGCVLVALAFSQPTKGQIIGRPTPEVPIAFYLVEDDSSSVSTEQFKVIKFEQSPEFVLRYMRPGDRLFVKTIGDRDHVDYFEFAGARPARVIDFFERSIAPLRTATRGTKDDTTDFGAAIGWCLHSANALDPAGKTKAVLVILSDGRPDPRQTPVTENLGAIHIFFVGVQRENESKLKAFLERNKLTANTDVIPFAAWRSYRGVFESKLGRSPNSAISMSRFHEVH
jgi:hypothetical protein